MFIKRVKPRDDSESKFIWDFITEMQQKYGKVEINPRGITRDAREPRFGTVRMDDTTLLDNVFYEIIYQNRMVASVYARRDTFNFTEVTMVEYGYEIKEE